MQSSPAYFTVKSLPLSSMRSLKRLLRLAGPSLSSALAACMKTALQAGDRAWQQALSSELARALRLSMSRVGRGRALLGAAQLLANMREPAHFRRNEVLRICRHPGAAAGL